MKITHVISSPASGGAEVYVKDLSIAMRQLGHEVHILFLSNAKDIGRDTLFEKRFLADLTEANVEFSFIGNKARKNPFFGISKLKQHISDFSPDILHCHLYFALVFSLFTKSVKVIYTHHSIKLKVPSFFYRIFDFRVSSYIGICHACTKILSAISVRDVVNINNSVSKWRIKQKAEYLYRTVPVVLMVGRFSTPKNYRFIIEVTSLLSDTDFVVKIAGEGEGFESFRQEVIERKLDGKINLLGNVYNVEDYMHDADIFAMTSSWEGLPISLIEASLTGLPTIVTNVGGCAEVSHTLLNGIVIDELDPHLYAKHLKRLISSYELRKYLSKNGLTYSDSYTLSYSVDNHLDLYAKYC
ncbi:glycosyltransferase family 4 protein [Shewanella sp. 10N.286.54.B9]|uniref:glycosyltransferase family 4 protein n=1 Tax=Shewanella sp. 10N.286.54.B9 TaxID=3229719 RepID=UPI00354B1A40